MNTTPTRGERNNNPGNIREFKHDDTHWLGERATDDDPAFEEFDTPQHGIRALAIVLMNYQRKHGLNTLRQIIDRWAPPNENDTSSYLNDVCQEVGVGPDEPVSMLEEPVLASTVRAIIKHENGRCIYTAELDAGVAEALRT